jgi:uncharacterized tellurite resistance protein B-like protein
MLRDDILDFLSRHTSPAPVPPSPFSREQVAAAALMVECAKIDADFGDEERRRIGELVREHFALDSETAEALIEVAERRTAEVWHDWVFLQAIKRAFSEAQQLEVLDRLWDVAYADGNVHRFENGLIQRVASELGIEPAVQEKRRTRARERWGGK